MQYNVWGNVWGIVTQILRVASYRLDCVCTNDFRICGKPFCDPFCGSEFGSSVFVSPDAVEAQEGRIYGDGRFASLYDSNPFLKGVCIRSQLDSWKSCNSPLRKCNVSQFPPMRGIRGSGWIAFLLQHGSIDVVLRFP